ncbi:TPM domain-containing protein [Albibacterium indicum]|uniref:TPM domain-containing protein n=1 Tax=Albibacterium indicum TaxID=2292082 RepID=UPI000E49BEC8|nr:TPM domain-containing protein [Pedobacter indicus]
MTLRTFRLLTTFFLIALFTGSVFADDFPAKPNRLVNDYTNTLSSSQVQHLENKLVAFSDSTTTQIAVVLISSLGDYDVADYAVRLAQKWGIGGAENDNGILLLASLGDRKVTIQTGYGVEGAVPDAIAYQIINNEIKPAFSRTDYFTGLDRATDALISYTKGEYKAKPKKKKEEGSGVPFIVIVIVIFVIISIFSKGGGGGRGGGKVIGGRGSSDLLWWTLLSGMGNRGGRGGGGFGGGFGGGGGGFGGGGFGGFGGGSFGGGGASGSW